MTRIPFALGTVLLCSSWSLARAPQSITKVDRLWGYLVSETQTGRDSLPNEKLFFIEGNLQRAVVMPGSTCRSPNKKPWEV
jgi:hypothetical protein